MSRLSNSLSKAELAAIHEAKLAGKILDRAGHVTTALHANYGLTSIAGRNRHTGKPHEGKREAARLARR